MNEKMSEKIWYALIGGYLCAFPCDFCHEVCGFKDCPKDRGDIENQSVLDFIKRVTETLKDCKEEHYEVSEDELFQLILEELR